MVGGDSFLPEKDLRLLSDGLVVPFLVSSHLLLIAIEVCDRSKISIRNFQNPVSLVTC